MIQYDITIKGRVQGVGFRHFARRQAQIFCIKGWIENAPNNCVLLRVQGEKEELDTFIDFLRIGPTRSNVTDVAVASSPISEAFRDFRIRG